MKKTQKFGSREGATFIEYALLAGLVAIGVLALYYLGLWLLRGRLRNEYIFNIKQP